MRLNFQEKALNKHKTIWGEKTYKEKEILNFLILTIGLASIKCESGEK